MASGGNSGHDLQTVAHQAEHLYAGKKKKVFAFGIDDWLNGTFTVMGDRGNRDMTVTSQISSLNIETLSSSALLGDIQISGRVDGAVTVNARPQKPWLATVDVSLDNFRTTHPVARQFRVKAVSGNITGSAIIGRRHMKIKEMVIHSDAWKAEVSGVLMPGRPLSASRLDLKANVRGETRSSVSGNRRPSRPTQNGVNLPKGLISFIIRGTLEKPSIQMSLAAD